MELPSCPPSLKSVQHYLKLAQEHDTRNIVVAFWARLYAVQVGLKLATQQPEETQFLTPIMEWLETTKASNSDNETITNVIAAKAFLENYALKLFLYADQQDRNGNFGKNVVKSFYSSSVIYDILHAFGELSDESQHNSKYAKWKAAYIHNCLKNGETPISGPMPDNTDEDGGGDDGEASNMLPENGRDETEKSSENNENVNSADTNTPAIQTPEDNMSPLNENEMNPTSNVVPPTAEEVLDNPNKLPSPPVDEEKPGGFEPFVPTNQPHPFYSPPEMPSSDIQLTPDQMIKAQKYCKYAGSALNYDDVKTAIENLHKALTLLTTGQES